MKRSLTAVRQKCQKCRQPTSLAYHLYRSLRLLSACFTVFCGEFHERNVQWGPLFKSAQDKSVRDFRAVKSACPVYTTSYTFPATGKSNGPRRPRARGGASAHVTRRHLGSLAVLLAGPRQAFPEMPRNVDICSAQFLNSR